MIETIVKSLQETEVSLKNLLANQDTLKSISEAACVMIECLESQRKGRIFTVGNGGSATQASHLAEELTGRYRHDRQPLAAMAIGDLGHITCVANDFGYEYIFSRFLEALGRSGDVLVALSTSGSSENVLKAADRSKSMGMKVVSLVGKHDTPLGKLSDVSIVTPGGQYSDRIQELHLMVIHILVELIEKELIYKGSKDVH